MPHGLTDWLSSLTIPDLRGVVRSCYDVGALRAERHATKVPLLTLNTRTERCSGLDIPDPRGLVIRSRC